MVFTDEIYGIPMEYASNHGRRYNRNVHCIDNRNNGRIGVVDCVVVRKTRKKKQRKKQPNSKSNQKNNHRASNLTTSTRLPATSV